MDWLEDLEGRRDWVGTLDSPTNRAGKRRWGESLIGDVGTGRSARGRCLSWSAVPFFRLEPRAWGLD